MSEIEPPILSYPPPSVVSRWVSSSISRLQSFKAVASEKGRSLNAAIAVFFKTSTQRVVQIELAVLAAIGFSLMSIGEWFLAILIWLLLGAIICVKAWNAQKGSKRIIAVLVTVIATIFFIAITILRKSDIEPWSNLQKVWPRKSVLTMRAMIIGSYGSNVSFTGIEFKLDNPVDDAIQNVDLIITKVRNSKASPFIRHMTERPPGREDCKVEAVDTWPEMRNGFKAADGKGGTIFSTRELTDDYITRHGSAKWELKCPRVSGRASLRFELEVFGDAEHDSLHVDGTYELISSKGSAVVKVSKAVVIMK